MECLLYGAGTLVSAFFTHSLFNSHIHPTGRYYFVFQMRKLKLREIKNLFTVTEEIRGRA